MLYPLKLDLTKAALAEDTDYLNVVDRSGRVVMHILSGRDATFGDAGLIVDALNRAYSAEFRTLPDAITPEIEEVLGFSTLDSVPIARLFRDTGEEISRKVEHEQAYTLFWLLGVVLRHGTGWRAAAGREMRERIDRLKAQITAAHFPMGRPMLSSDEQSLLRALEREGPLFDDDTVATRGLLNTGLAARLKKFEGTTTRLVISELGRMWIRTV